MASDKDVSERVVVTMGAARYTETVTPREKKTTWTYKRPKDVSDPDRRAIKKLTMNWDENSDPDKNCKKFAIAADAAPILEAPPVGVWEMAVAISLKLNLEEGRQTITMTEKKGKLSYKARK